MKCTDGLPFPQVSNYVWPMERSGRRSESRRRGREEFLFHQLIPVRLPSEAEGHRSCQAILFTLLALYPGSASYFPCFFNTLGYCTILFTFPTLCSHFCKWSFHYSVHTLLNLGVPYLSCQDLVDLYRQESKNLIHGTWKMIWTICGIGLEVEKV